MTRYPGQVAGYRATDKAGLPDARLTRDQNHAGSCVVQAVTDEVNLRLPADGRYSSPDRSNYAPSGTIIAS
jgi:hypothetical protein